MNIVVSDVDARAVCLTIRLLTFRVLGSGFGSVFYSLSPHIRSFFVHIIQIVCGKPLFRPKHVCFNDFLLVLAPHIPPLHAPLGHISLFDLLQVNLVQSIVHFGTPQGLGWLVNWLALWPICLCLLTGSISSCLPAGHTTDSIHKFPRQKLAMEMICQSIRYKR